MLQINQSLNFDEAELKATNPEKSPLLIVHGINRASGQYYIWVDNRLIKCDSPMRAIQLLIKIHFVLDICFESNIRQVLNFLTVFMFKILAGISITSEMRLLYTALQADMDTLF